MNITILQPKECTLTEYCDEYGLSVIVGQTGHGGSWCATLDRDPTEHHGWGPSPERAIRNLGQMMAGIAMFDNQKHFIPKLTGIREAGDWDRFEI